MFTGSCFGSSGQFGSVYKGEWRGMTVAVKRTLCYATEARLLASLRHRNIVRFFGACTTAPDFFLGE